MKNKEKNKNKISLQAIENIKNNIFKYSSHPQQIKIIVVTKGKSQEATLAALQNKEVSIIGESRVQETEIKIQKKQRQKEIHFIGRLQRNKVRKALAIYSVIHSVDSMRLAKKINSVAKETEKQQKIFLQINITNNKKQTGFKEAEIISVTKKIKKLKNLQILGIMGIGPNTTNKQTINNAFSALHTHQQYIQKHIIKTAKYLSMGMSKDYIIALKNGATHIRIGTLFFQQ